LDKHGVPSENTRASEKVHFEKDDVIADGVEGLKEELHDESDKLKEAVDTVEIDHEFKSSRLSLAKGLWSGGTAARINSSCVFTIDPVPGVFLIYPGGEVGMSDIFAI